MRFILALGENFRRLRLKAGIDEYEKTKTYEIRLLVGGI